MRNPVDVLKNLTKQAKKPEYKYKRLYRNFYNPEFYILAYKNIYATKGSMTPGIDGRTIDNMSLSRINKIINKMRDKSYQPNPVKRVYIDKKNSSKKRPLGIPSADDKLIQGVTRLILESIFEPNFSINSHGFRPKRSCHTALTQIQKKFKGVKWFIEGDIRACFDSFDHHILIDIIRQRVADEHFIALLWKFLRAGYMEQFIYEKTHSGAPQGSGISPILANIYLNKLDEFMDKYKSKFDIGERKRRKVNPKYTKHQRAMFKCTENWEGMSADEKKTALKKRKEHRKLMQEQPYYLANDSTFKRLQYGRYADDFIIGIIGSKQDAQKVKSDIARFINNAMKLEMSMEKSKITHSSDMARFLGYDITVSRSNSLKKNSKGQMVKAWYGAVQLYVPHDKWFNKLMEYKALKIEKDIDGKDKWIPTHRGQLINMSDEAIVGKYNSEIRGLYNYYCLANNATVLSNFGHIMEYSMYKTFAGKYRTSMSKIIKQYKRNGVFTVNYMTKQGIKQTTFYNDGFKRKKGYTLEYTDLLPQFQKYIRPNSLIAQLRSKTCELCGETKEEITIHQVKKLKDLKGNHEWERIMIGKRRKTMAVCIDCHNIIHYNC
uniref:reverse transcriptase domain-containing protein n=1 Tax=Maledivibacter halophilus TaxID=36842 RepID=UPI0009A5A23B|nr:reverse transcriptase domain-containing protein [Maledivibacter halophilus]